MASDVDWGRVTQELTLYAYRRLSYFGRRDAATAEELAMEALRAYLEAARGQHRADGLLHQLRSRVNGLVINHVRLHRHRYERPPHDDATMADAQPADPRARIEARSEGAHLVGLVRARLIEREDRAAVRVFEAMLVDIRRPKELAAELEWTLEEVKATLKRLRRVLDTVRQEAPQ